MPLFEAARCESAAALFIVEPEWVASAECDAQHLAFAAAQIEALRTALAERGLPLLVRWGDAPAVLAEVRRSYPFTHLLSHEETGSGWSFARDRQVADWCRTVGVEWREWPQTGVVRRLRDRAGWAARWQRRMNASCAPVCCRPYNRDAAHHGADRLCLSLARQNDGLA